jgi:hypothetical protein
MPLITADVRKPPDLHRYFSKAMIAAITKTVEPQDETML